MLKNAYFLAKIGADTAENEQHFAEILPIGRPVADRPGPARHLRLARGLRSFTLQGCAQPCSVNERRPRASRRCRAGPGRSATGRPIGKISAKCCSFSAVSAPIFARKYAFFSIFQNLPDNPAELFEIWRYFANFATFTNFLLNFHENC